MESGNQTHVEFNKIVLKLAQDFINLPLDKIDKAIHNAIQMMGAYCGADRITIYLYDWEREILFLRNEWVKEQQYSIDHQYKVMPFSQMTPDIFKRHMTGKPYTASILNNDQNKDYSTDINKTGAKVTTSIPLISEGLVLGTCILSRMEDKNEWDDLVISSITIFCEMLTSVLKRIETKKELIENNVSMRLLLDSTNDAIAMLDTSGIILNVNKSYADRFGTTPERMIGKDWLSYTPGNIYGGLIQSRISWLKKVVETEKPVMFEDVRDGMTFYNRFYPVFKNGEVNAVALFSTDITDKMKVIEHAKKTAEYEARVRIQTEFFTNISHEFKTPLSIILAQLELMKLYMQDEDKMHKYIRAVKQNTYRLTRLLGNLLDIMKLDAGYLKADMHYTDIVTVIKETTELANNYALAKNISLHFETKLLGYYMAVDQYKTEKILLNLLSNAIKFTQKGGRITVTVKGKKNGVLIIVSDTGAGIPKEKIGYIFHRFIQVDTSLAKKAEGSGIGLSLTKLLVELLQGKIWVKSNPGKGSAFFVELPMLKLEEDKNFAEIEGNTIQERVEVEFSDIYFENSKIV